MQTHGNSSSSQCNKHLVDVILSVTLSKLAFHSWSILLLISFQTIITLFRQSLKYQSLVEEHLHHGDICSSLCANLLASFHNGVELAEQIKHAGLQVGQPFDCFQKKVYI